MSKPSLPRPGAHPFGFTSERAWGTLGCGIAVASASFGLYMNFYGPAEPDLPGRQYLTLFAQPRSHAETTDRPPATIATREAPAPPGIDPSPTGSIGPRDGKAGAGTPTPPKDFRLRDVFEDTALVEDHDRLRIVKVGTILTGLGPVTAIEKRDGRWTVVTAAGVIVGQPTGEDR